MTLGGGDELAVPYTEDALRRRGSISVSDVVSLRNHTSAFLVNNRQNPYGIQFTRFTLRNLATGEVLMHMVGNGNGHVEVDDVMVRYVFPPDFLSMERLGVTISYRLNAESDPIDSFVMLERHFFNGQGLTSFKFDLGPCASGEERTVENTYEVPALGQRMKAALVQYPFLTKSDCFFFINGLLVLHFKAEYSFDGLFPQIYEVPV